MRLTLPPNLQEQIDRAAQDSEVSKQKKLLSIIELYFNDGESAPYPVESAPQLPSSNGSVAAPLVLQSNLAFDIIMQNQSLREQLIKLHLEHQWLLGEYALVTIKLLPAAEKTLAEKPWWIRLVHWLKRKNKSD